MSGGVKKEDGRVVSIVMESGKNYNGNYFIDVFVMKLTLPDAYKTISRAVNKLRKDFAKISSTRRLIEVAIIFTTSFT